MTFSFAEPEIQHECARAVRLQTPFYLAEFVQRAGLDRTDPNVCDPRFRVHGVVPILTGTFESEQGVDGDDAARHLESARLARAGLAHHHGYGRAFGSS